MIDYELLTVVFDKQASLICGRCKKSFATGIALILILRDGQILTCVGMEGKCCFELPREVPRLFDSAAQADQYILDKYAQDEATIMAPPKHNLELFLRSLGKSIGELQFCLNKGLGL